ncbi:hypothetical protein L2089_18415 [Paenibacillus hunanensis]|uniref:hypothetical protein n=1 Tax=Paenibacillus hunanensis TaxID=539262 RepID=UPI002026A288|nr:hypothetical protein [Paenibacillus hunanensis]MCL9662666.1 hypothetical protein [Paenibacillus hunanensis]
MKKWIIALFSTALLMGMSNEMIAAASSSTDDAAQPPSVSTPLPAAGATALQAKPASGTEYYHSVVFSVDFMETIMTGDSEPRGRFYQALQQAIGAPVIFYDFWNDYIVIKIIDKKLTPAEAEAIKDQINSLDWIYDTYDIPRDQEFITDIHWFDRWS